ncbi:MAG: hypothetical protein CHACPFDD_03329 [Phycisphaerae bacterium]|nr:hypothetical protein [Phycisphaerae bacterium]
MAGEPARVLIISPDKPIYRDAADALNAALRQRGHATELMALRESEAAAYGAALKRAREWKPAVIATGGAALTLDVLRDVPQTPVAFFMVPNVLDAPFLADGSPERKRVAGVPSDVSPADQIAWIAATAPDVKRVCVLHGERTRRTAESLASSGRERGIEVVLIAAREDAFMEAASKVSASEAQGVVMIPDSQVYNGANIQHLLLWGIREKRAVWAFSDKAVKAGAFAGFFVEPADVGRECAEAVEELLRGPVPDGPRYCARIQRAINVHTASLIALSPDQASRQGGVRVFGEQP